MTVTNKRIGVKAGDVWGADEINSIARQGVQVFTDRAARNAAMGSNPQGLVWVSGRNELQLWDGKQWKTLTQGTSPDQVVRALHLEARTEDSVPLAHWGKPDPAVSIPAGLSLELGYPVRRLSNPFGFSPIPLQGVFDNQTSTGGVLEFGQETTVGPTVVRQLTAAIDAEVHVVLVSPGQVSSGAPSDVFSPGGVRIHFADGAGGGGEIAEAVLRIAKGESIYVHGTHYPGKSLWVVHRGQVVLHVATGSFSPGRGAAQVEATGKAYNAAGNALRPTPTVEPRYNHPVRLGGLCYEPGGLSSASGGSEYGTAGTGASFTANGNDGRWRGQYPTGTTPRGATLNDTPVYGPPGVTLDPAHWALTNNAPRRAVPDLQIGNGGAGYRTGYSAIVGGQSQSNFPPAVSSTRLRYGEGAAGSIGSTHSGEWLGSGGPGCCLIRYSKPTSPLVPDLLLQ